MKTFLINLFNTLLCLYARVAVASSEAHEVHSGNVGPSMGTLLRGVNFLLLIVLLVYLLRKPAKEFFANRSLLLKKDVEESGQHYALLLKQSEELNAKISRLEADGRSFMNSFKEEAELEKKKLLSHAGELSEKMKQDAISLAATEVKKAKEELREVAVKLAAELAEKKIRQDISTGDQDRLNTRFVDRLKSLN